MFEQQNHDNFHLTTRRNLIISLMLVSFVSMAMFLAQKSEAISAGALDGSFGTNGKVTTDFGFIDNGVGFMRDTKGYSIAIQPDGKIVVAGSHLTTYPIVINTDFNFALARYNINGTLDTSFDSDGKVTTTFGQEPSFKSDDEIYSIALQPDGKIVAAGRAKPQTNNSDFALTRYNSDGSLDTSFDSDGKLTTDFDNSSADEANGIAVQLDGKIVVVGFTSRFGTDFALARYNANGSLDSNFGFFGKVTTDFGFGIDIAQYVSIQSDGKIVVAGRAYNGNNYDFALARYNPDGSLDTTFDNDGKLMTDFNSTDFAYSLAIQPDGKIIVIGYNGNPPNQDFALVRYNIDGSLDSSFDGDGKLTTDFSNSNDTGYGIAIQPDGKIIVCGASGSDYALARYNSDGSLDTSFDIDGKLTTNFGSGTHNVARAIAIQSDGKIVSAGYTNNIFSSARYLNISTVTPICDFDGDNKTDISIFRPSNGQWWYQQSSDNVVKVATFGISTDKIVPADYDSDGKTDIAFFRPSTGEWFVLRSSNNTFFAAPFGVSTDIPAPGDFDGDGKADFSVFRPSNATWFILKTTGGVQTTPFGTNSDIPSVADYDGDGKADIAIYRPNGGSGNGEWWILKSSGGVFATPFGSATDKPVPADYTGDGKADVAFRRPSTGEWYVLRSEDLTFYAAPFGANGDIPVAGDYDGDGKADLAVFRPSSATWFVLKSSGGTLIQGFGSTGDIPVPSAFVP